MTTSRLFTSPAGSALWAPEVPCLVLRFHGSLSLTQYQQLMDKGLEIYQHQAPSTTRATWIADTRQLNALPDAAQQWTATDWNFRAYAAGLRHLRFVEPETSPLPLAQQLHAATQHPAADSRLQLTQHETLAAAIQQTLKAATVPAA